MGKKTKRKTSGGANSASSSSASAQGSSGATGGSGNKTRRAPALASVEANIETLENLRFQDAEEDEFIEEEVVIDKDEEEDDDNQGEVEQQQQQQLGHDDDEDDDDKTNEPKVKEVWMPGGDIKEGEELEFDASAYTMYHALKPEWPCLSFDIIRDSLGGSRSRFPHTVYCCAGTQAAEKGANKLQLMKMSDLAKTYRKEDNDEEDAEAMDSDTDDDEGDDNVHADPVLEHRDIKHYGCVNRLRSCPQKPALIATHSETAHVHVYDLSPHLASFDNRSGSANLPQRPIFSHSGHREEGYALDWSRVEAGMMLSGDCSGGIELWNPRSELSSWEVTSGAWAADHSVEDIQWSPSERTVFAAGDCGGNVQIYDVRQRGKSMLCTRAHSTDVNVISWNGIVTNLLASGADDGAFSVWDLRKFKEGVPLAKFTTSTKPITSVEWHPTDESMVVVTDEDACFIYDLSIEEDAEEAAKTSSLVPQGENKIPPQLLFMHLGSTSNKEAHWHPQIPSCVMTTALTGFNVFIPSNL